MRKSGILLPVTSLPSAYGIGDLGKCAYEFIDFLASAGQSFWQILPLSPTSFGDSPYQSFSAFAGNPYMISLEILTENGLLTKQECNAADFGTNPEAVDYEKLYKNRFLILKKAFKRSSLMGVQEYEEFIEAHKFWLDDYCLFMALKDYFGGKEWLKWPDEIKNRNESSLQILKKDLAEETDFWKFVQFEFFSQWKMLKEYANRKGIQIIGDIPIYVAMDSSDTWANPQLFQLDENKMPLGVAGCPPDGFSAKGQLWGNPLYDWDINKKDGYSWWISRIKHCFLLYDYVRIDHFRGFDEYYSIPYPSPDATHGEWKKGPGISLFDEIEKKLGKQKIIAEDLGFITPSVKQLLSDSGFWGMKVLQFAFDERDTGVASDYLPHNYPEGCVAYTGTHDNQTLVSWFLELDKKSKEHVRKYLCDYYTPDAEIYKSLIASVMRSGASICIFPMQDILGTDDSTRINTPGTCGSNWRWRLYSGYATQEISSYLKEMTLLYGRCGQKSAVTLK